MNLIRVSLFALVLMLVGAFATINDYCRGVTATGQKFIIVLPQHTGSDTVVRHVTGAAQILQKEGVNVGQFNGSNCLHFHTNYNHTLHWDHQVYVLAANPFKRMISSFAFDYQSMNISHKPISEVADLFRTYIRTRTEPPRRSMVSFLQGRLPDFIVHTHRLQVSMNELFHLWGLPPLKIGISHCISSCSDNPRHGEFGNGADFKHEGSKLPMEVLYKDMGLVNVVRKWYAVDFTAFGFSTDPLSSHMLPT